MSVNSKMTALANSIRAKSGVSGLLSIDGMKTAVDSIQTGGTVASTREKDVNFIDYDGTILYSYTLSEAQALTELPELPSNDGLICQGWNWSLADIKALNRAVTVGASYVTADGATRLKIRIATTGRMTLPLYFNQTVENGVSIDWGDESTPETLAGTGQVNTSHTYTDIGDYTITLVASNGCNISLGSYIFGNANNDNLIYLNMLQGVQIGNTVTAIGDYAFVKCYSLSTITIPNNVSNIGVFAFNSCYSLKSVTIPNGITSIKSNTFVNCRSLSNIAIPNNINSILTYAFNSCFSLSKITIPDSVTSISDNAFSSCYSLTEITIPSSVTSISKSTFENCYALSKVTITSVITSIGTQAFHYCCSLSEITIPSDIKTIGNYTFGRCYSLAKITIPSGVTSIGAYAFINCYGISSYDFSSCTAVPTLADTNAFSSIADDCQILVPSALYDEWSAATNWADYASYMVAV